MLPWLAHCVSTFCLRRLGRLSLRACRSSFLQFWLAEDRIVLGDVSWQLGLSLFILGYFFLLGMGLGSCIKWVRAAEFFDPTRIKMEFFILKGLFGNVVLIMLFVFFWKYMWVKKYVKICVILFKNWKMLLKITYQTAPQPYKWLKWHVEDYPY